MGHGRDDNIMSFKKKKKASDQTVYKHSLGLIISALTGKMAKMLKQLERIMGGPEQFLQIYFLILVLPDGTWHIVHF